MKRPQLLTLLEKIAVLQIMAKYDVSSKEAKLLLEFPDIKVGNPVRELEAKPY